MGVVDDTSTVVGGKYVPYPGGSVVGVTEKRVC